MCKTQAYINTLMACFNIMKRHTGLVDVPNYKQMPVSSMADSGTHEHAIIKKILNRLKHLRLI